MNTVATLRAGLLAGKTTSRRLTEHALARIRATDGEGARSFLRVYEDTALLEADLADRYRKAGIQRSSVDGLPISVKDLFDVAGDVTRAGSVVLNDDPPAGQDAPAVARLRAAGAVLIGRTNMVEFAFGGTGLNPHYGTPRNPWARSEERLPGGSSSGAAVAVAEEQCVMGLATDTRGSIRIPSALCGLVGFKPTARRVPREGVFPLSYSLDSVGPIARSVACCAAYDAVLAGDHDGRLRVPPIDGLRLAIPRSSLLDDVDPAVGRAFERVVSTLSSAGASLTELTIPEFDRHDQFFRDGGLAGAEAAFIHRERARNVHGLDPRVGKRIATGSRLSAADYVELIRLRAGTTESIAEALAPFDAALMPTVPCLAPTIAEVDATDESYFFWNGRLLRNPGLVNFFDGCALSLPCNEPGAAPVGLMVFGPALSDRRVLCTSAAIERCLDAPLVPGGTRPLD